VFDGVGLVEHRSAGLDRHGAAVGHGVPRIDDEVDEDLVKLAGVGAQLAGGWVELDDQRQILPDESAEHRFDGPDGFVEIQDLGADDLLAAEGEELLGQGGRPFGRVADPVDALPRGLDVQPCMPIR